LWPPFNRQRRKRRETGSSRDDCYGGVGDVDFDCHTGLAEKPGGVLRMPMITSPASMSIHEESTIAALGAMMGVFNNVVMFDQHLPQNSLESIVPDLASSWSLSEDGKELTFKLRQGVKWHDGKRLTAKDVKCTWDLIAGTKSSCCLGRGMSLSCSKARAADWKWGCWCLRRL
jgi:ABC-type transport system substrate-binding protein